MVKIKRVSYRQIQNVPFKEVDASRRSIPYLRRIEQQNVREKELKARKTSLTLSTVTFDQQLSIVDNGQLTTFIQLTLIDEKTITPLNFLTDIWAIQKLDGYLLNTVDEDFRLTGDQGDHEYWNSIAKFTTINRQSNQLDIVAQFTNRSGVTQDYFFEYRLVFIGD